KMVARTNIVEADECTRSSENGEAQRAAFSRRRDGRAHVSNGSSRRARE
ncbi:hypothetical protein ALC60_03942, partial [Trachymyrmex zeteki]